MIKNDRLSKGGINLIFSKIKRGEEYCVFFRFTKKTIYLLIFFYLNNYGDNNEKNK